MKNMWNWVGIEGKRYKRERESTLWEREKNLRERKLLNECVADAIKSIIVSVVYWKNIDVFLILFFKLYYLDTYAFYTFEKTYNKNTFLLRWFIAFICLNGEILFFFGAALMSCRMMRNRNRFFPLYSSSFLEHHSSFMTIVGLIK